MTSDRDKYLRIEFMTLTINGALGRSWTYEKSAPDKVRAAFRKDLQNTLYAMEGTYNSAVTEKYHISNIETLADSLSAKYSTYLIGGRFRIGVAQKAINLYLKYLWCIDSIHLPPHCPFDRNIIIQLPWCGHIQWTEFDSIAEYMQLIEKAKEVAKASGYQSLAEWELALWNKSTS